MIRDLARGPEARNTMRSVRLLALLVVLPVGCQSIYVRKARAPELYESWRDSAAHDQELSTRTLQTLRRWDLEQTYRHEPADALFRLQVEAENDPQPDLLFALAEVSYLLGHGCEKKSCAV